MVFRLNRLHLDYQCLHHSLLVHCVLSEGGNKAYDGVLTIEIGHHGRAITDSRISHRQYIPVTMVWN